MIPAAEALSIADIRSGLPMTVLAALADSINGYANDTAINKVRRKRRKA